MQITKTGIHYHKQLGKEERKNLQGLGESKGEKK